MAFGDSSVQQERFLSGQKLRCHLWTLVSVHRGTPPLLGGHFPMSTLIPNAAQNPRKRTPPTKLTAFTLSCPGRRRQA